MERVVVAESVKSAGPLIPDSIPAASNKRNPTSEKSEYIKFPLLGNLFGRIVSRAHENSAPRKATSLN
jgi:hypothetical protein